MQRRTPIDKKLSKFKRIIHDTEFILNEVYPYSWPRHRKRISDLMLEQKLLLTNEDVKGFWKTFSVVLDENAWRDWEYQKDLMVYLLRWKLEADCDSI